LSHVNICELQFFIRSHDSENEKEIENHEKVEDLLDDTWVVRMRGLNKVPSLKPSPTEERRTSSLAQNSIEQVRSVALENGIVLRIEDDDMNDPIHDNSSKGGPANFNPSRKEFNKLIKHQFFLKNAKKLGMDLAEKYSLKSPLDVDKVWQQIEVLDVGQAINNLQNGLFPCTPCPFQLCSVLTLISHTTR
jgi:hypothetical protein